MDDMFVEYDDSYRPPFVDEDDSLSSYLDYRDGANDVGSASHQQSAPINEQNVVIGLNSAQIEAVTLGVDSGASLILAGAGTGKTSVLTKRIAWLSSRGVSPENMLAVTFTNKAAREMRERLESLGVYPMPMVGTFHSIGLRLLKMSPASAGVREGFTILDADDAMSLWKKLFVFSKNQRPDPKNEFQFPSDLENLKSIAKRMFDLKENGIRSSSENQRAGLDDDWVGRMLDVYERARQQRNMVDFSDLISGSLEAMKSGAGNQFISRFTHVMVDEFQDTSSVQFKWIRQISRHMTVKNLFCVGDDCQSIYSFRGAVVENMSRFVRDYSAKEIMLEQNYRCGAHILTAANSLISKNPGGGRKKLWTDSHDGDISYREFNDDRDESDWIATDVEKKNDLANTAILLRTRAAMLPVALSLRKIGVTYQIVGAQDFFDRKEIRDAIALIKIVLNPRDEMSFRRVCGFIDGAGKVAVDRVISESDRLKKDLLSIGSNDKNVGIREFCQSMQIRRDGSCSDIVFSLVRESGLYAFYSKDEKDVGRLDSLHEFIDFTNGSETVRNFLEEVTLFAEKKKNQSGVTISTIHAAKGLEWKHVYLPALSDGHLPSYRGGKNGEFDSADMEEERRLMYVGITRAKESLNASFAKTRFVNGQVVDVKQSRFVCESKLNLKMVDADKPRFGFR